MNTSPLPAPNEPLRVALIGFGARARMFYVPILKHLTPWIEIIAVCDPDPEHLQAAARELDVRGYADVRELLRHDPPEAAIAVTPVDSHHALSVTLSERRHL